MPSDEARPPYSTALATVPYAVPFTAGVVFLVWGGVELIRLITTYYGDLPDLLVILVILAIGSILLLYGSAGALSAVIRDSTTG